MSEIIGQWLYYNGTKPKKGRTRRRNTMSYAYFRSWAHLAKKPRKGVYRPHR